MILVTGCGRSGTGYMAECLQQAGLDVGHERLGADGISSWLWAAPFGPYPVYHTQVSRPKFDVILHQVREPLATIGSAMTFREETWRFIRRWVPIDKDWGILKQACHYWYWWNTRVKQLRPTMRYRVEDAEQVWPEIMTLVGCDAPFPRGVSEKTNSREHFDPTWPGVKTAAPQLANDIAQMAQRYGYDIRRPSGRSVFSDTAW